MKKDSEKDNEKTGSDPASDRVEGVALARKRLLARMAGNIACGVVSNPSEATASVEAVASISVDIAEGILQKIGL